MDTDVWKMAVLGGASLPCWKWKREGEMSDRVGEARLGVLLVLFLRGDVILWVRDFLSLCCYWVVER